MRMCMEGCEGVYGRVCMGGHGCNTAVWMRSSTRFTLDVLGEGD